MTAAQQLPPTYRLAAYDEIDSTNEEAKRLAIAGAPSGTVVWAKAQSGGKGRQGRPWVSQPGNLYCSLILEVEEIGLAARLGFAVALAVADTVTRFLPGSSLFCKWPNDVLLEGRKISGILLEAVPDTGLSAIVIGCGINAAHHPEETAFPATSLGSYGEAPDVGRLLETYIGELDRWLSVEREQGFGAVRTAWLERAHRPGDRLTVRSSYGDIPGNFVDLAPDGALILDVDGVPRSFTAGDVFFPASNVTEGAAG